MFCVSNAVAENFCKTEIIGLKQSAMDRSAKKLRNEEGDVLC